MMGREQWLRDAVMEAVKEEERSGREGGREEEGEGVV